MTKRMVALYLLFATFAILIIYMALYVPKNGGKDDDYIDENKTRR